MKDALQSELSVAVRAVREASRLCREVQRKLAEAVLEKNDKSPVTVADFGSQALICRALQAAFPDDPVIGEEDSKALRQPAQDALRAQVVERVRAQVPSAGEADVCGWIDRGGASAYSPRFWTLDPIDGTKGFLRGGQYAVALALVVGGQVAVAALGCPNLPPEPGPESGAGVIFWAVRGGGAFAEPLDGPGAPIPLQAKAAVEPAQAVYCESVESRHSSQGGAAEIAKGLGITRPPRRLDSMAKYALVARGECELYIRLPTGAAYTEKMRDHAAGALVATEGGATVTDIEGKPLDFTLGRELSKNRGVLVTSGGIHARVVAAARGVAGG